MAAGRHLGRWGELSALVLLLAKGYRLRHRNWRGAGGELDLVMEHGDEIVFVEVKARSGAYYGGAAAAVDRKKRQVMARTAAMYLSRFNLWERPSRFDVVVIESRPGALRWRIRHLTHAFRPDRGREV